MTPSDVRDLLGEPLNSGVNGPEEVWRYYARVRESDERRLLGLIPVPDSKHIASVEVLVHFDSGTVRRVTCPEM